MKGEYDYLFVTHLPAFYKVNLYNHIAKHCRIFVIFIANSSKIRTQDFIGKQFDFDYCILNHCHFEERWKISSLWRLFLIWRKIKYKKMVLGGWDLLEYWCLAWLSLKSKNALALESSIHESANDSWRGQVKKVFLSRVSLVFASGEPHLELLRLLKYQGLQQKTLGVGIFNYSYVQKRQHTFQGRFLYVGRLASEKNVSLLLQAFNKLPQFTLTIVGSGPLWADLKAIKPSNVTFMDHIPNEHLATCYQQHDIFILPSLREPWGLVVEEALFHGLPVIASNKVGCAKDLIEAHQVGTLFYSSDPEALAQAILWASTHYEELIQNFETLDLKAKDAFQVQQYVGAI